MTPAPARRAPIAGGIALLLGVIAVGVIGPRLIPPSSVDDVALTGQRSPDCVRVVALPDLSGSMTSYTAVREQAMEQIVTWAPRNLRGDDQIAVVPWDDAAAVDVAPTTVAHGLGPIRISSPPGGSGGTAVAAAVEEVEDLPVSRCRTDLIFISDGQISDSASTVRAAARKAGIADVSIILTSAGAAPREWTRAFPTGTVLHADPMDSDQTALAVAQALAHATGQRLDRR